MDREEGNKEKMRKCRERISQFPHSLSISSPFPRVLSISSSFSHYLSIFSQPGCQAAASCATLSHPISIQTIRFGCYNIFLWDDLFKVSSLIFTIILYLSDFHYDEIWNFKFYMVSSCSILFTVFRTIFVFAH